MPGPTVDLLALLKSLTPDQLVELGNRIEQAKTTASDPTRIPVQVALHIDVNDSTTPSAEELHAALAKASGRQSSPLTLDELGKLQKAQPALIQWISKSKENAALFAADPIRALRKSDTPFDKALLTKLEALNQGFAGFTSFAGVPIKSVVLQAKASAAVPAYNKEPTKKSKEDKKGGK